MSISSEISRISQNISDSLTAVANKGVTVPSGSNSDDLADLIAQISGGGGTSWQTEFSGTVTIEDWGDNVKFVYLEDYFQTHSYFANGDTYRITWQSTPYTCVATQSETSTYGSGYILGNPSMLDYTGSGNNEPFGCQCFYSDDLLFACDYSLYGSFTLVIEKQVGGGGSTLVTKTITANGTYDPADDDADGYSEVTVAIPSGTAGTPTATKGTVSNHSISVTPSVTNTAGVISGGTITGTAVTVSASELVSGSETKTSNGTYDVTNLAQLVVNVSGGSGLVYETGTYTPSTDTTQPTISFSGTHSNPPVFIAMSDTSSASGITSSSNVFWTIIDFYKINGEGYPYSTSAQRFAIVYYGYRSTNGINVSNIQTQYNSDNTGTGSTGYYRYWATASNFKPSSNSTSRYWRSGRNYKWIAVWAPST